MSVVTGEEVRTILGPTEDAVVARILASAPRARRSAPLICG